MFRWGSRGGRGEGEGGPSLVVGCSSACLPVYVKVEIQSRIQKNMALFQAEMARVNRLQDSATAALDHLAQAKVEVEVNYYICSFYKN